MPKNPTAFITGIAGFAGSYLAEELLEHGYRVIGNLYASEPTDNLAAIIDYLTLVDLDILDASMLTATLARFRPSHVFHLAAFASVGKSFAKERLTYQVNVEGTLNVLQAALSLKELKKLVFVSSADCYGIFSPKNKTLTEGEPLAPISPYGISKTAAEHLCRYYFSRHNLPVTIARSFNHSGPRQTENFVIPAFARQVAAIELKQQRPDMAVGDLTARRDFSDVRDIVRGYRLLAEKGRPGRAYHFSSGKAVAVQSVLDVLLSFTSRKVSIRTDMNRLRKSDIPVLRGSHRRASQELGFANRYTLKQTLKDTFDYWMKVLSTNPTS